MNLHFENHLEKIDENVVQLVWEDLKVDVNCCNDGLPKRIRCKIFKDRNNEIVIRRILKGDLEVIKNVNNFLNTYKSSESLKIVSLAEINFKMHETNIIYKYGHCVITVSGYAQSGNMIAIMGPSGAGKTTLLAALGKKIKLSSGSVKVNGCAVSKDIMSGISSYVPQFDALPLFLTVEEYMTFTCALKQDAHSETRQRGILIENLLLEIGLYNCKHRIISNLSGGQKKRLSLASEMVMKPKILFFDEPTTGLDTFAAAQVIESLKTISAHGTIVFCSIHQPAMAIYEMFTHVTFMTDGKLAYFGTVQNSETFFKLLNFHCPVGFDEVEYYMSLLSNRNTSCSQMDFNAESVILPDYASKICDAFSKSPFSKMSLNTRSKGILPADLSRTNNWCTQLYWILWRILKQSQRSNYKNWIVWISYAISIGSIVLFYINTNSYNQKGIQNVRGILFMTMSEIEFNVAYMVVYEFPSEIPLYLRESTMYGSSAYYCATVLGVIPRVMLKTFLFTIILYILLNTGLNIVVLFLYCIYTVLITLCGISYGFMISGWIENYDFATSVMVPIDILFLLTAGVYLNIRTLPFYVKYLKYLSVFYYGNEGLSIIHWSHIDNIECTSKDITCLFNGEEVLAHYGYNIANFYFDMGGLLFLTILMNFIGYLGVRRKRKVKAIY